MSRERIVQLTDESVRLLELIRAGAEHSEQTLPRALSQAANDLERFEERVRSAHGLVGEALRHGEELAGHAASVAARRRGLDRAIRQRSIGASPKPNQARCRYDIAAIAGRARGYRRAFDRPWRCCARGRSATGLEMMTGRFADESAASIERGLREHTREAIAQLEASAERASAASREAALQLRDQLAVVNELAGNLEHRVAHARQPAEEQVDNDFARRMALITESLNSSAIDITKAFDNDVTDTAWASYLRGDRGIFTRRAVRLLDNQRARAVAEIYQADARLPRNGQPLHPRFRGDAAPRAVDPRRPRRSRDPAVVRHGQALRRAGPGDRAAARPSRLRSRMPGGSSKTVEVSRA